MPESALKWFFSVPIRSWLHVNFTSAFLEKGSPHTKSSWRARERERLRLGKSERLRHRNIVNKRD